MISNIAIMLIGLSAFMHKGINKLSLLCFSGLYGLYAFADSNINWVDGSYYYILSAAVSLFIIYTMICFSKLNTINIALSKACLMFIYLNLLGWVAYEVYIEPLVYNAVCAGLFIAVLFYSINTRNRNVLGNSSVCSDRPIISSDSRQRAFVVKDHEKAARS